MELGPCVSFLCIVKESDDNAVGLGVVSIDIHLSYVTGIPCVQERRRRPNIVQKGFESITWSPCDRGRSESFSCLDRCSGEARDARRR